MANEEINERLYGLIDRLEERVNQIDAQRTSPTAIATALSGNLNRYLSALVSSLVSKKAQEEEEAKKPRSILRPTIPIDVVSISPAAAMSIVSALERAGIGKYDIDIKQFDTVEKEERSGSFLDSIIKSFGTVTAWLAGLGAALFAALGPWAATLLGAITLQLGLGFGRIKSLLGKVLIGLGLATGAAALGYAAYKNTLIEPEEEMRALQQKAESNPHSLFISSPTATSTGGFDSSAFQAAAGTGIEGDDYLQSSEGKQEVDEILHQEIDDRETFNSDKSLVEGATSQVSSLDTGKDDKFQTNMLTGIRDLEYDDKGVPNTQPLRDIMAVNYGDETDDDREILIDHGIEQLSPILEHARAEEVLPYISNEPMEKPSDVLYNMEYLEEMLPEPEMKKLREAFPDKTTSTSSLPSSDQSGIDQLALSTLSPIPSQVSPVESLTSAPRELSQIDLVPVKNFLRENEQLSEAIVTGLEGVVAFARNNTSQDQLNMTDDQQKSAPSTPMPDQIEVNRARAKEKMIS